MHRRGAMLRLLRLLTPSLFVFLHNSQFATRPRVQNSTSGDISYDSLFVHITACRHLGNKGAGSPFGAEVNVGGGCHIGSGHPLGIS